MKTNSTNKRKILNDPIYGFISIPGGIIFDLVEHPYFQRLRRISQLGLTYVVYPGAYHTRFHHALGAMHLMQKAILTLRAKGHHISNEEEEAACIAILLHDIGHGPFSHAMENSLVNVSHEHISEVIMEMLNKAFNGKLDLAILIFQNRYHRKFLHQLISSQLDVDRLDYLKRDSFYSGVSEGVISSDRIIAMLNITNDELVVEAKGIYSVEKFIIARRLMYWQVYLHKTVLSAEFTLVKILQRAKELVKNGEELFAGKALHYFLYDDFSAKDFDSKPEVLKRFTELDDYDVITAIKEWCSHSDKILSMLCQMIIHRRLLKVALENDAFDSENVETIRKQLMEDMDISEAESHYLLFTDSITNNAYSAQKDRISLQYKNGKLVDIAEASDQLNISVLTQTVKKYFLCYPKAYKEGLIK